MLLNNFNYSYPKTINGLSFKNSSYSYTEDINNFLRGKKSKNYCHSQEKINKIIPLIDSAMQKYTKTADMVVYRFCKDPSINEDMTFYSDKGFMSTVKRPEKVYQMLTLWGGNDILKIHIPRGTQLIDIEKVRNRKDEEAEVILPRNSRFRVSGFITMKEAFKSDYKEHFSLKNYKAIEMCLDN